MGGGVVVEGLPSGNLYDGLHLPGNKAIGVPKGHLGFGGVGNGDGVADGNDADVFATGKFDVAGGEGCGFGGEEGVVEPCLIHFGLG